MYLCYVIKRQTVKLIFNRKRKRVKEGWKEAEKETEWRGGTSKDAEAVELLSDLSRSLLKLFP